MHAFTASLLAIDCFLEGFGRFRLIFAIMTSETISLAAESPGKVEDREFNRFGDGVSL